MRGRRFIVTGGFGALGQAMTRRLIDDHARVAAIDRTPSTGVSGLDGALLIGDTDLADPAQAERAVGLVEERFHGLDGLVNIAGTFRVETLEQGSVDTWDLLYRINLRTAVCTSQAALRLLEEGGGRIVNVGAAGAVKAAGGMGPYAAAKAGVAKLTESLAEEMKEKGVTVNAVLPSIIDTPDNRSAMPGADFERWVSPEALAAVIAFLLSDQADAITGALIPVTGRV